MSAKMQDAAEARWDDVRIFLAAHRHKSLGAAAAHLGLDTSTVSRRVSVLEETMGVRLFERTREGLLPTGAAERVLAAAEAMEAAHGRLTREASDVEAEAEGVVRMSVAPGMADAFVAPALPRLRARYPKIRIELDASVQPRDLTRYEADLALRSVPPQGAELLVTKIASARWIVMGSPDQVKQLGRLRRWTDAPWITWDRDLSSFGPSKWVARYASKADIVLRTSHFASQLTAADAGLGILLVPAPYGPLRKLRPVRFAEALEPDTQAWPIDTLWLVGHRALRDVPRVAVVWSFLAEEFRRVMDARSSQSYTARGGAAESEVNRGDV
ncbi:LysR family transcriptional regulator [Pendulispora albinea]|uniref:LysR family transcriptional regulator n=1 Tax=Pendulispora albinea TaxID=2741071 RepID=A0ABZ2M109_9BACT